MSSPRYVKAMRVPTAKTAKRLRRARRLASSGRYSSIAALSKDTGLSETTLRHHKVSLPHGPTRAASQPTAATLPSSSLTLPGGETMFSVELPQPDGRPPLQVWTNFIAGQPLTRHEKRDAARRMRQAEGKETRRDQRA